MNIILNIKEEPKDADTCSLELKEPETHGENFSDATHNPELKFQSMTNEFKVNDKIEIKEELLNCNKYSTELKPKTEEGNSYDAALKDEEEKGFVQDLVRKIKVEELNLPASDIGPYKEDLSRCLKNSSSTSFFEVTQDCKGNTKKQIYSGKLYSSTYTSTSCKKSNTLIQEHQKNQMKNEGHLKIHRKAHICEFCGKSFTRTSTLREHLLIHEGKKPHKCEICGKSFTWVSNLRKHLLMHDGKKPHECEVCGKSFTQTFALREHLLMHEGKKPHKCEVCGKNFTFISNLRQHLLIHNNKKPHKCEVCGKSFTQVSTLSRHLLLHEGKKPHECEICGKGFTRASYLWNHRINHKQ